HAKCAYRSDVSPSLSTSEITGPLFSLHDTPGLILCCPVGSPLTPDPLQQITSLQVAAFSGLTSSQASAACSWRQL
ncbi:hypothetical protein HaLaN_31856, partial [Haematococcus lacustris]